MIYEDVEFVIRAALAGMNGHCSSRYPDNVDRSPTVSQFSGSMGDATASARRRIDGWMGANVERRVPPPNLPNTCSPRFLPQRSGWPDCSILNLGAGAIGYVPR